MNRTERTDLRILFNLFDKPVNILQLQFYIEMLAGSMFWRRSIYNHVKNGINKKD